MPPKPPLAFPLPLSIGTDICHIPRIHAILMGPNKHAKRFLQKTLTWDEYEESRKKLDGALIEVARLYRRREHIVRRGEELGFLAPAAGGSGAGATGSESGSAYGLESESESRTEDTGDNAIKRVGSGDILKELLRSVEEEERTVRKRVKPVANFLAGRFAAKEAAIKAHTTRRLTYQDIAIRKQFAPSGLTRAPLALIRNEATSWEVGPAQIVPLSISHDEEYATATCIAWEDSSNVDQDLLDSAMFEADEEGDEDVDSDKEQDIDGREKPRRRSKLDTRIRKLAWDRPTPPTIREDIWIRKFRMLKDGLHTRRVPRGSSPWR
ncbi:hypothetical protein F5884DRAFT_389311 [Xylogone sp. PMI_703]|nr:hypothetical protein F5884DRAFT_389311 [Xylogone sp. PMI_703]